MASREEMSEEESKEVDGMKAKEDTSNENCCRIFLSQSVCLDFSRLLPWGPLLLRPGRQRDLLHLLPRRLPQAVPLAQKVQAVDLGRSATRAQARRGVLAKVSRGNRL